MTVSMSEADVLALELERRGMVVGTRGIYAVGDDGFMSLRIGGTKVQWQALLFPPMRPEQVVRLTGLVDWIQIESDYTLTHGRPVQAGRLAAKALSLRQWLEQQQGGEGR